MVGLITVGLAIATALPIQSRSPDPDFARVRIALFREIRITDAAGVQRSGVLLSIDDDTLHLVSGDGSFTASIASTRRIEQRGDRLTNGVLIGGAVGVFFTELTFHAIDVNRGQRLRADLWVGSFYAIIGGAIDALHTGWTTVKKQRRRGEER